ncbi:UNVERIFIED_CONTAM: putative WRKY transcription factor 50 [Sesamum latifolium]|uniref:WRKY transcription factor 50 n=1 Tax=Sesamum latifolium TaxID=2727402 RepID=A0AAW2X601_9LAMI
MNTTPQFQDFPNTNPNPNFEDQFAYTTHLHHDQLNGSKYFRDIFNYLMSDEDLEELTANLHSKTASENTVDFFDKFSSSAPLANHNMQVLLFWHLMISLDPQLLCLNLCSCFCRKRRRKVKIYKAQEELRLAFRTRSDLEVMDDGFKWRKYGKKKVKSSPNPR